MQVRRAIGEYSSGLPFPRWPWRECNEPRLNLFSRNRKRPLLSPGAFAFHSTNRLCGGQ
jgi:hypothetical protein